MWGVRCDEDKYFAMITPLLSSYLDESADKEKKKVLCVGGILIHEENLRRIQDEWITVLRDAEISYFHYTECKGLHGEFLPYRNKYKSNAHSEAEKVMRRMEGILLSGSWIGFSAAVLVSEYIGVLRDLAASKHIFREDPTESTYGQLMWEIARQVRKNAKGFQVAYFIDSSADFSKIYETFRGTKINHPVIGKTMVSIAPLDDKTVPALQMADLLIGTIRDAFVDWLQSGRPERSILDAKWNQHVEPTWIWDKAHMLRLIRTTIRSRKLKDGTIAIRPRSKPSGTDLRRQEKNRRKMLWKGST